MARKSKNKREVAGHIAAPQHYGNIPSPREQRAMQEATVNEHLRKARSALSLRGSSSVSYTARRHDIDPDIAMGVAVSGKTAAYEKENARVKEYYAGVNLREEKKDDLKCRPKSTKGNGSGRPFVPWSKKC